MVPDLVAVMFAPIMTRLALGLLTIHLLSAIVLVLPTRGLAGQISFTSQRDGNADYAKPYWPLLLKWAEYLKEKGMDPDNQLSTDDFAGHLAHNTNLSIKAILALGGFAQLARTLGHTDIATQYMALAKKMAVDWERMANDGDHYRLAFDRPGTWRASA